MASKFDLWFKFIMKQMNININIFWLDRYDGY